MTTSVTGIGSLNYTGVGSPNPPNLLILKRAPNSNDSQNVTLGTLWLFLEEMTQELWFLVSLSGNTATWVQLFPGSGGGAGQFVTNSGTANESGGVLNVLGTSGISTAGSGNTVTISNSAEVATSFPTDSGTATPSAGALTVHGGSNINTSGALSTVTINLDDNVSIGTSLTLPTFPGVLQASNAGVVSASRGDNGELLIGNTGVNPVWTNLISSDSSVLITNGAGSIDLTVSGSNASSFVTQSGTATPVAGVLHVNGTNLLTTSAPGTSNIVDVTLTNGSDGQVIIGGGASPVWANITSLDDSIVITTGANSIDLSAVGGGGGGGAFNVSFSAYQATNAMSAITFANQTYTLGSSVALTVLSNVAEGLYEGSGSGSPATFTAPISGNYYFLMRTSSFVQSAGATLRPIATIATPSGNFQSQLGVSVSGLSSAEYSDAGTYCVVPLNINDVVTFRVSVPTVGGSGSVTISGSGSPYKTYIGGFLIKSGSFANAAFQAVQSGNAVGVTGGSTLPNPLHYSMGSSAIMIDNFNPGDNFFPGDGMGTPCNYTAPMTGLFQFNFTAVIGPDMSGHSSPYMQIVTPGATYESYTFPIPSISFNGQTRVGNTFSAAVPLTSGDQVTFVIYTPSGSNVGTTVFGLTVDGSIATYISGYQVA